MKNGPSPTDRDSGLRILIVEDSVSDAALVEAMIADALPERGCDVEATLAAALDSLAGSAAPDCILLDLGLPDSQGIETLDAVVAAAPQSAVIVLTGLDEETLGRRAITRGAQDFMSKNAVDARSLGRAMRDAVERKRAADVTGQLSRRQELVATLGLHALAGDAAILDAATQLVLDELGTNLCAALEASPESTLRMRAGAVSPAGIPGMDLAVTPGESMDYALRGRTPVAFSDVATEPRFRVPPELLSLGVRSGLAVVVMTAERVWGVMVTADDHPRQYSRADEAFLQQVGNVVGASVQRESVLAEMTAAVQMKQQFIENVSHELRTPMNGVLGLAESLVRDETDPVKRLHLLTLRDSANHLMEIIDEVTDFAALSGGAVEVELVDFDVHSMIERVVGVAAPLAKAKNLHVALDVAPHTPRWVRGDRYHLRRVLTELVDNAVKFTDAGYVEVRMAPTTAGRVRFEIVDTGIGMDGATSEGFVAFKQGDATRTRRAGGLGLGLAICSQLTDLMGAKLAIDSIRGRGSTVSVELSLPSHADRLDTETELPPLRVLVVDDVTLNRLVVRRVLERLGHNVDEARDGVEAVEAVSANRYDAVLMDCLMPEMDGYTATAHIRALEGAAATTPIIAVTALSDARDECIGAGMDDFVTKPVNRDAIDAALHRTLGSRTSAIEFAGAESGNPASDAALGSLDPQLLAELRTMSGPDGADLVRSIIDSYREESAAQLRAISHMAATGDVDALRQAAHALKGMSAQIGARRLPELCTGFGEMDAKLWSDRIDQLEHENQALVEALAALDRELAA